jgi:glycosyltransferase involved in cell wall biosynthesis
MKKLQISMKTFLVHDWLYTYGGAERVLEAMSDCVVIEKMFTLMNFMPLEKHKFLKGVPIYTSFLQNLPWASSKRRYYLPLMPLAIESFDVSEAELIISSSAAIAKGVNTLSYQLHICYCHSPARYIWDLTHHVLANEVKRLSIKSFFANIVFHYIRLWDVIASNRVDYFIANSHNTAKRIWRAYRRESRVIYPPVDVNRLVLSSKKDYYYLTISRLVPYKKIDLVVEAFAQTNKKLVVVGEGPELARLKKLAKGNVEIIGYQPDDVVLDLLQRARAFVFASHEDFGIAPVEAQACGTPVIAYGHGGSLETVRGVYPGTRPSEKTTGIFFPEQTAASLLDAIDWFEQCRGEIKPEACRRHAEQFSRERFLKEFSEFVEAKWAAFRSNGPHS